LLDARSIYIGERCAITSIQSLANLEAQQRGIGATTEILEYVLDGMTIPSTGVLVCDVLVNRRLSGGYGQFLIFQKTVPFWGALDTELFSDNPFQVQRMGICNLEEAGAETQSQQGCLRGLELPRLRPAG